MSVRVTIINGDKVERFNVEEDSLEDKTYLLYGFPERKKEIAKLSYDKKMEWYATRNPEEMVWLGNSNEFQRFWKIHVLWPTKVKRFYYRVKNGEIFKKYAHISDMKEVKKKIKNYCI